MRTVNAFVDEIRDERDPAADPVGFELDMARRFFKKVVEDPVGYAGTIIGAAARFWREPQAEWTNTIAGSGLARNIREMWDYRGFRATHIVALGIAGMGALGAVVYRGRQGAVFVLSFPGFLHPGLRLHVQQSALLLAHLGGCGRSCGIRSGADLDPAQKAAASSALSRRGIYTGHRAESGGQPPARPEHTAQRRI